MKKSYFLILFILFCFSEITAETKFGYISYSTTNIGDDFQAIAAKRFLPKDSIPIDREFIGEFKYPNKIFAIVNGWFMHTKDIYWYLKNIKPPEQSWPPSHPICPLLISIHFIKPFLKIALSEENVKYLKKYGPVGARDYYTLNELQEKGVPSYFSGCLTLTLDNPYRNKKRNNIIYAVDIKKECIDYIKSKTKCEVVFINHGMPFYIQFKNDLRIQYAEKMLEKYQRAKCVITERLHAAMPCIAFETPVLLITKKCGRFDGLRDLTRHCSLEEFLNGEFDFDFDNPPDNPKTYIPIRENLIKTVNDWVNSNLK